MNITIYRATTGSVMQQNLLPKLLQALPVSLRPKALRYQSQLSTYNYIIGRLLLKHGLESFGLPTDLSQIAIHENGKPFLPGIHFNISHSDQQVICAFSKEGLLGVDLEKIKSIDFENFTAMFSTKEWRAIKAATDPVHAFYWHWTRKESIIKALGLKLEYLHRIEIDASLNHFEVDGKRWFLQDIDVGDGFLGAVCCEEEIGRVEIVDKSF